ncbi:hypothetical protein CHUAL_002979 [Chamberlinius hualienensis]
MSEGVFIPLYMMDKTSQDFQANELDTLINVIGLTPSDPLDTFAEMWYQVFLWALFSSIFAHAFASGIAFCMLRQHKIGRFIPLAILLMGVLSPLTGGVVTSAAVAGVYRTANFQMAPLYALVWGIGQTVLAVLVSYTRILATL